MDVVTKLAEHIVAVRYETCLPDALLTSKLSILDTLGAAMAGHSAAAARQSSKSFESGVGIRRRACGSTGRA